MIKTDVNSNAQTWELEITCKNRKYLNAVVTAILEYGLIEFEVNSVDGQGNSQGEWEGRYTVLLWCSWFNNLKNIVDDLAAIEDRFEGNETPETPETPIDNVTVQNLDATLRLAGIEINKAILDRIIDVVELLESKGGKTTLKDVSNLMKEWNK